MRILVVDDDPVTAEALAEALEPLHEVGTASSAEQGLAMCGAAPFDVVVADHGLPGMTGVQMLQALRAEWPNTSVIVVTGRAETDIVIAALNGGACAFFQKPIDLSALIAKLQEIERTRAKAKEACRDAEELRRQIARLKQACRQAQAVEAGLMMPPEQRVG